MAAGGGGRAGWIALGGGLGLLAVAHALGERSSMLRTAALAVGGLSIVFGSCEALIAAVEGFGRRMRWNRFVAGTMAGLASNVPELVMLGFVVATDARVAFVVVVLTLHVNALALGIYSALLPRDATGQARLPTPLVELSTDLYATAGGIFLITGLLMVMLREFKVGQHDGQSLAASDLYALAVVLLVVEGVAVVRLVQRFSQGEDGESSAEAGEALGAPPSFAAIAGYGVIGVGASVVGGHAVGEFADVLVVGLRARGYSEMVGAILLSVFAGAGTYVMMISSHARRMYDVALANVSGSVIQVPFVVLPVTLILMAAFTETGVVPRAAGGGVLPIDFQTTAVLVLAFPTMLLVWKSVQDDGHVNWVETAGMTGLFALTVYFLALHG